MPPPIEVGGIPRPAYGFVMPHYVFNGIRFHFHPCVSGIPAVRIYPRTANTSSERHATDRRTNRRTDELAAPHFIMPPPTEVGDLT